MVRTVSKRIDLNQFEELIESIVICEEEYIKGQDSLLEDCQTLKDRMQIILAELKKHYELLDEIVHIWFCSPHISEEHHADITKLLADYWGKTL